MDINQASQMITWLDEEHRRDKAQLTELRQKVESQKVDLDDQSKRIQEMESRLAATQGKLGRFNTLEQAIQNVRDELVLMVRVQEEEQSRYQREQTKTRQLEQESGSRALNELRRSLEAIPPLQEKMTVLKAEDQRLGEIMLNLQTRLTSHERQTAQLPDRITYVEGQRAQDVKVIAQMQEEVVTLLRRVEALGGKHDLVDDIARKNEQRITALSALREELSKRQSEVTESMRLKEAQIDRQLQEMAASLVHFEEENAKQRKLLERFSAQHDETQQMLASIDEYRETINREQRQVAELQRMAEERIRRELEEWIAANEQRWTKFRLERESQWHQQQSRNEEVVNRLKQLDAWHEEEVQRTHQLARELMRVQQESREKFRELWTLQERTAIFHLDEARRWYDKVSGLAGERAEENGSA